MLKIGIIGIGNSGYDHVKAYSNLKNGKLTSICDIDMKKLEMVKEAAPDCILNVDLDDFLNSGIEIVDLCTPCYENMNLINKIVKRSKHILCGVPISASLESANTILEITKNIKTKFMAGQITNFFSNYNEFKKILNRGKIGEVGFLRTSIGGGYPASYNNWLDSDDNGGGVILNLGIHHFYYIYNLFGDVERVYAKRKKVLNGDSKKDYALIILRFKNKNIVHVELSWAYPDGTPYILKLDAFGTNGQVVYDDNLRRPMRIYDNKTNQKKYNLYRIDNPLANNPYKLQMESFIDCIEGTYDIPIKLEDSIYAQKVAYSCLKSANDNSVEYIS